MFYVIRKYLFNALHSEIDLKFRTRSFQCCFLQILLSCTRECVYFSGLYCIQRPFVETEKIHRRLARFSFFFLPLENMYVVSFRYTVYTYVYCTCAYTYRVIGRDQFMGGNEHRFLVLYYFEVYIFLIDQFIRSPGIRITINYQFIFVVITRTHIIISRRTSNRNAASALGDRGGYKSFAN